MKCKRCGCPYFMVKGYDYLGGGYVEAIWECYGCKRIVKYPIQHVFRDNEVI